MNINNIDFLTSAQKEKLAKAKIFQIKGTIILGWLESVLAGDTVRPGKSGRGLYENRTPEITSILDVLKFKYTTGNDAPRGGACGFYVVSTNKALLARRAAAVKEDQRLRKKRWQADIDSFNEAQAKKRAAIVAEADTIAIDFEFKFQLRWASQVGGKEKSDRCVKIIKALLERNGIEVLKTDFWQVFRILKAKAENSN